MANERISLKMNQDLVSKTLKSGQTFLKRWRNDIVQISEITWSGMRIKIEQTDKDGYLLICCIDPVEVFGLTKIRDANIEILHDTKNFIISDLKQNFKVQCPDIEIKEYLINTPQKI